MDSQKSMRKRIDHKMFRTITKSLSGFYPAFYEKTMENRIKQGFSIFQKNHVLEVNLNSKMGMVVGDGFEPSKSATADLQSAPFGRSGIPPNGAGEGNRTLTISLEG